MKVHAFAFAQQVSSFYTLLRVPHRFDKNRLSEPHVSPAPFPALSPTSLFHLVGFVISINSGTFHALTNTYITLRH